MENFNNDEVTKMLEMLKMQAESATNTEKEVTQATENTPDSADDLKNMLKKQFSAEDQGENAIESEDYSFDEVSDFVADEEADEVNKIENTDEEEIDDVQIVEKFEEEDLVDEESKQITETDVSDYDAVDLILKEANSDTYKELDSELNEETGNIIEEFEEVADEPEEIIEELDDMEKEEEIIEDPVLSEESFVEEAVAEDEPDSDISEDAVSEADDEMISEESIDYGDVLEGQQGTVFNEFVEDLAGDLEDVVFEAEITDSHAPNKQYTIFEDWEQLMKSQDFAAVEEDILPPDEEELAQSQSLDESRKGKTDYFNPVVSKNDLDAVDIALMVALGGKSELNETVGFEKIRQAVEQTEEENAANLEDKKIYGYCGDEYSSLAQNGRIRKKYHSDKTKLLIQVIGTAFFALITLIYELSGWSGREFSGVLSVTEHPTFHVLAGLVLLIGCVAVSGNKLIRLFKDAVSFSSVSYIVALVALVTSVLHDVLIITTNYASPAYTIHSVSAVLLLIGLVYDLFDLIQQAGVFNIVSSSEKKLVLEPYGKIRVDDNEDTGEMIDQDSYCISRVPSVKKYFARTQRPVSDNTVGKLIPLIVSFSVAICVALLLLLVGQGLTALFSLLITLSFLLVCTVMFESETAFFIAYQMLKKNKTGIIGKSSVAEHGKCNIVYFDDFNVFNKKSVRTKGLKLYDNNEIYRILYHTQAVFSKVGGPLKGVFEFATTEMTHSKRVEIKEISKEGISAVVDGRTAVLIGTGAFMRSRYIHPSYTAADIKLEEKGEESIMFIALNGILGAKLYVTYQFSSEFEKLAKKLNERGVNIGIRSSDPNVNNKWAKNYGRVKKIPISIVRPTLKEIKPNDKSIESGVISTKNVRSLAEALMMCIKLDSLERILGNIRTVAIVLMGILSFALTLLSGINAITMLVMSLACAFCTSIMILVTYFYIKR